MVRLRLPLLGFVLAFACIPKIVHAIACGREVVAQFQANIPTLCTAKTGVVGSQACMQACYTACHSAMLDAVATCEKGDAIAAGSLVQMLGGASAATTAMASAEAPVTAGANGTAGAAGTHGGAAVKADNAAAACSSCVVAEPFVAQLSSLIKPTAAQGAATTAQATTMSKALSALKSPWVLGAAAVGAGLGYFLGKGSGDDKNEDGTDKEPTETPAIPEPAVAEAPPTSSAASSVASQATVVQAPETITNPGVMLTPIGGDNDSDGDTSMTVAQATPYQQDFESTTSSTDDSLNDDDTTTLGAGGGSENTALASNGDDDSASAGRALAGANTTDAAAAKANAGAGGGAGMGGFSFDSGAGASAAATGSGGQMLMGTPGSRKLASGSSSSRSARRNLAMVVNNLAKSIALVPANSASALPALTPAQERSRLLNTMQSRGLIRKPAK